MIETIERKLAEIELMEDVRILFAIESGSRAWGFASPDSDYDVRFIYIRPAKEYLRLNKRRDVIECIPDDVFDINGWDLDKTLRLLHNSNPTLFEWCGSPIVYRTSGFHQTLKQMMTRYFLSRPGIYHYLSMANGNYREYLKGDTVKLKKYFYVIRPLLACRWILKNGTPPPMLFSTLMETQMESELCPVIDDLLKWKMSAPESQTGNRMGVLNDWIDENLIVLQKAIEALPPTEKTGWQELNELFLRELELTV